MAVESFKEILDRAFADRYGVAAFNVVNDLTIDAVLTAATELEAPVILQTSVKTVKSIGAEVLYAMLRSMADKAPVPVTLHLDHCPDRAVVTECLEIGWNSVLFDGSELPVDEARRQTIEVVAEARRHGAHVEGEIEGIRGVEDGVGSDEEGLVQTLEIALDFIRATGIDCFAPAIGTAHGMYAAEPELNFQRVSEIVAAEPIPICLHGGTGLTARAVLGSDRARLRQGQHLDGAQDRLRSRPTASSWRPIRRRTIRRRCFATSRPGWRTWPGHHIRMFGSEGKA